MKNHPAITNDEITLLDLGKILVRWKWWVLATLLLALIAAMVTVFLIKPQWEATAAIRVGAVGRAGLVEQAGQAGQVIEPVARVVERMKLKSYKDAVLSDLGYPPDEKNPEADLYRSSLTVKALPNTDLIAITVRGHSREEAKRSAEATVAYLQKIHDQMANLSVQRLRALLAQTEGQITQLKAERERVLKVFGLKDKVIGGGRGTESLMLANIMIQGDGELRKLEQAKVFYEEQLDSLRTYPTSLMEGVSVSENPVAPKKAPIFLLAGILGLILAVLVAFVSHAVFSNKQRGA
jgi:uncharacterized protein involved in exopolysaccharide biosynthesis